MLFQVLLPIALQVYAESRAAFVALGMPHTPTVQIRAFAVPRTKNTIDHFFPLRITNLDISLISSRFLAMQII